MGSGAQSIAPVSRDGARPVPTRLDHAATELQPGERMLLPMAHDHDDRFTIVACVRADFVERVSEHAALAALIGANTLFVPPMTADELRRVVEGPTRRTGVVVELQLVEAVIADVEGRPGALPLLSTALLAT
jgi:hypothetical protein